MYLILTSKEGQFRTETEGLTVCEAYDYLFHGQRKARFAIVELDRPVKVRVIDEVPHPLVNEVPSKFFPTFASLEQARAELRHLTGFGGMRTELEKVA